MHAVVIFVKKIKMEDFFGSREHLGLLYAGLARFRIFLNLNQNRKSSFRADLIQIKIKITSNFTANSKSNSKSGYKWKIKIQNHTI